MDKVILTNFGVLSAKYGPTGLAAINAALERLVAADKARGLDSVVIGLDDAAGMGSLKVPVVTNAQSGRQAKDAIDAIYRALTPDYIMILGSSDVVPHQSLANPVFDGANDPDRMVPSDLPYACDAPYGGDASKYTGPTRVVGRLPDITGGNVADYLVGLIETAVNWTSRPRSQYASYLGISAAVWEDSTALSLQNVFGNASDLQIVPTAGPKWEAALLARRAHFVNCHGALANPHYYGQQGSTFPIAHDAAYVAASELAEGTVIAAECCYGAELYNPVLADNQQMGMCNTYLSKKAYAFLGSSTIAYGPASGNGSADYLCQFFLNQVLAGASVGRAALMARQEFVRRSGMVDPVDLKTLAQFSLMGDPSIQPVVLDTQHQPLGKGEEGKSLRAIRRRRLSIEGTELGKNTPVAKKSKAKGKGGSPSSALKKLIEASALDSTTVLSFNFKRPGGAAKVKGAIAAPKAQSVHVVLGRRDGSDNDHVPRGIALVVWEEDGKLVSYRELHQR
ncbi:MAG TPA: hypothetical protein VHI13_01450 [Candidatus Kapabacteria bacterium]|nr:hypothetical protein [Candidatus Kapabacteria bacterium]